MSKFTERCDPDFGNAIVAQGRGVGEPFRIRMNVQTGFDGDGAPVFQQRVVEVIAAIDDLTGETIFIPIGDIPDGFVPTDFEPSVLVALAVIDQTDVGGAQLATVRKHGSSTTRSKI